MRLAKSFLYAAAALGFATSAAAQSSFDAQEDWHGSPAGSASVMYEVDDDGDGRPDRVLYLEESDTLA